MALPPSLMLTSGAMDNELTPVQSRMLEVLESRRFWGGFVILAVVLLGIAIGKGIAKTATQKRELAASEKLFEIEKLDAQDINPQQGIFTQEYFKKRLEWPAERKDTLKKLAQDLVNEYPESAAAQNARLRLALQQYLDADYEGSIKAFDEVVAKSKKEAEDIPYWNALLGKASALEMLKKDNEALAIYEEMTKEDKKNPLMAEALFGKMRMYIASGRQTEVGTIAKKLREDYAGTHYESAARAIESDVAR